MEEKNVQNSPEMSDRQLEQSSGGFEVSEIKVLSKACPRCGKGSGVVLMTVFKCPYCGYQEAYVM